MIYTNTFTQYRQGMVYPGDWDAPILRSVAGAPYWPDALEYHIVPDGRGGSMISLVQRDMGPGYDDGLIRFADLMDPIADVTALVRVRYIGYTPTPRAGIAFQYRLGAGYLFFGVHGSGVILRQITPGGGKNSVGNRNYTWDTGRWYYLKMQDRQSDGSWRAKWWAEGEPEPAQWQWEIPDLQSQIPGTYKVAPGVVGIAVSNYNQTRPTVMDQIGVFAVGTDGDEALSRVPTARALVGRGGR